MAIKLFGIANCDTVKKARAWFAAQGLDVAFHDFKREGLSDALLAHWLQTTDWDVLLNRRGTTWRRLDEGARASVHDARSASALMQEQPSLVKRPVVEWADGSISVGFDASRFSEAALRR